MASTLYERLGGTDAIAAVARAFEERAGGDDRINQKFAWTNPHCRPRLTPRRRSNGKARPSRG